MRNRPVLRAFTLIELLVVIGIIAFLVAVMLPAIARAKEQGKQVKCLAGLKQIGTAMRFYGTENNEWFPYEKRNVVDGSPYLHGFYYGGHPGRSVKAPNNWWGYIQTPYRDTPRGRPFNRYIYSELPNWDVPASNKGLFEGVRQMDAFKCTNDTGGFWMNSGSGDDDPTNGRSLYYETGSSYDLNYHHAMNWGFGASFFNDQQKRRWLQRCNAFLKQQQMFWSAHFVILYEDPFDSAQWLQFPRRGWHRQLDRHNFLFLDGHAANTMTRTKEGTRGRGWKTASGKSPSDSKAWWNNKDDPDYQYRLIDPVPGW